MQSKRGADAIPILRRKPRLTGWLGLGWRVALMIGLLGLLILIHWLERDGLTDNLDGDVSLVDVIYFTMISALVAAARFQHPGRPRRARRVDEPGGA